MRKHYWVLPILFLLASLVCAASVFFSEDTLARKNAFKINLSFSIPFEEAKAIIQNLYPNLTSDQVVLDFIEKRNIQRIETEEGLFLFSDFEANLFYRDPELQAHHPEWTEKTKTLIQEFLMEYISENQLTEHFKGRLTPYFKPRTFYVDYAISVPKEELPETGFIKLWIPLPLLSPSQNDITFVDIQPQDSIQGYPVIDGDIAYLYLRFDMETIEEALDIKVAYTYTRYQQHFDIDESNVGPYDVQSPLYLKYTRSAGNITYDERFTELALAIVGEETNPFRQAKKIYDYIIENVYYSYMAHSFYEAMGIPESIVVLENGFGDCGSQSIFFSALCRSIGIPARTTGGFQLFSDHLGTHFWAEFYLPDYGWIPIDTSVGQVANHTTGITEEQRHAFKEYFFGNLDSLRLTVQNDVDFHPDVKPEDIQYLGMVLQLPYIDSQYGNAEFDVSYSILSRIIEKTRVIR